LFRAIGGGQFFVLFYQLAVYGVNQLFAQGQPPFSRNTSKMSLTSIVEVLFCVSDFILLYIKFVNIQLNICLSMIFYSALFRREKYCVVLSLFS
jgi:hypothetical protein